MSHTNSTTNYSLPQFVTTDKPAWLTDVNNAYTAIDTGIHNAQTKADTADNNATQALSDASAASTAAATADAKGAGAVASIADTFDPTATYAVRDLVIYNSLLYICTVAVTTPGAWTGTANWTRTTIETQMPTSSADLPITPGSVNMTKSVLDKCVTCTELTKYEGAYNTNASGTIDSNLLVTGGIPYATYDILSAFCDSGTVLISKYSNRYVFYIKDASTLNAVASTAVNLRIIIASGINPVV